MGGRALFTFHHTADFAQKHACLVEKAQQGVHLVALFALHLHSQKQNPPHKRNVRTPRGSNCACAGAGREKCRLKGFRRHWKRFIDIERFNVHRVEFSVWQKVGGG